MAGTLRMHRGLLVARSMWNERASHHDPHAQNKGGRESTYQDCFRDSQSLMQAAWKACWHGRRPIPSPWAKGHRQMEHILPCSRAAFEEVVDEVVEEERCSFPSSSSSC